MENDIVKSLVNAEDHALKAAIYAKDVGVAKVKDVAGQVDKTLHSNPWPYVAGAAGIGLLLGYILGRDRK